MGFLFNSKKTSHFSLTEEAGTVKSVCQRYINMQDSSPNIAKVFLRLKLSVQQRLKSIPAAPRDVTFIPGLPTPLELLTWEF